MTTSTLLPLDYAIELNKGYVSSRHFGPGTTLYIRAAWVRGSSLYCESEMYRIGGLMNSGMILYGAQQWPVFLIGYFQFQ
jgi:hypothetical protein